MIETILAYRLPKLTRQEIQAMLGLTHADLKKSVFYQEVFVEGRQEEGVALLLRQLQRRFGRLPVKQTRRMRCLSLKAAETLAEEPLDFQGLDDLAAWLDGQADPPAS